MPQLALSNKNCQSCQFTLSTWQKTVKSSYTHQKQIITSMMSGNKSKYELLVRNGKHTVRNTKEDRALSNQKILKKACDLAEVTRRKTPNPNQSEMTRQGRQSSMYVT